MCEVVKRSDVEELRLATTASRLRCVCAEFGDTSRRGSAWIPITRLKIASGISRLPSFKSRIVTTIWRVTGSLVTVTRTHLPAPSASFGITRFKMPIVQGQRLISVY